MDTNIHYGMIQQIPKKCEFKSGTRKTPSFSKIFHEAKRRIVGSTTCVCTQDVYCAECLCTEADTRHGTYTSVSLQKMKISGSLIGQGQLVCTLELTKIPL
jgi:hypothetical protein